ncbi:MAG TPA: TPM domain-containing protein [Ramlibacter sp.]|nr:TPM domain-containing protein [Ramlibacter sp.]
MNKSLRTLRLLCALCVLCLCALAQAQNLQPIPPLTAHVIDQTGTLDAIQIKGLEDKLMAFEQSKGSQMAILMVATTHPEDDASFANRVGNAWKIGRKGVGDGVLIVVAKDDHKVRIEVAKALEGAIPDLAAKNIIDDVMIPKFKQGDFAGGLRDGVDQLIARINGEPLPAPAQTHKPQRTTGHGFDWGDLAIFLFVGVFVAGRVLRAIFGRPLGSIVTGGAVGGLALLITSSMLVAGLAGLVALFFTLVSGFGGRIAPSVGGPWIGGGGFGRGGGFGGGFGGGAGGWGGSGGGGDFGGGGASGNW